MEQNCFALRQIPSNGNLLLPAGIYLAIRGNGALRIRPNNPARISPALSGEICRYLDEGCKHAQGFISASVPSSCMLAGKKTKCNFHDHVTQEPFSTIRGEADSTSRQRSPWRGQVSTNAAMLSFLHQLRTGGCRADDGLLVNVGQQPVAAKQTSLRRLKRWRKVLPKH